MTKKTLTFVKQLEKKFESPETARQNEPTTLAEHVSNELMTSMPRISPELFEMTRAARIPLSEEQIIALDPLFYSSMDAIKGVTTKISPGEINAKEARGTIPRFVYSPHEEAQKVWKGAARATYAFKTEYSSEAVDWKECCKLDLEGKPTKKGARSGSLYATVKETDVFHRIKGKLEVIWEAPPKLDINVKTPPIPKSFISLGDDAIAEYFEAVRKAPTELREKTELISPRIGVLWSPKDNALYCTGKIPKPRIIPSLPSGDPALILDIPDGDRSYKHVVALWDIGEEMPFRNWLAEYSEGGR